ncbi:MAG TPA: immunoglobulin domain-containing protein [Verrucomicrobiales bacterium]|nr:immunoglobulin domain-containing protein [Verrucomicrobiales bacterium]
MRAALPLHCLWVTAAVKAAPPVILFQPVEQRAVSGGRTELGVSAQNAPGENSVLGYQWMRNGKPVPGANSRLLVFSPVRAQDAGMYQVIVRSVDGETWSRATALHVVEEPPAPGTLDTSFAAAKIENTATGTRGTVYALAPVAEGGVLIGGDFSHAGGIARPGLAKLTAAGELDVNFVLSALPAQPVVRCLAQVPGGWLAGGMATASRRPWLAFIPEGGGAVISMETGWTFNATSGQEVRTLLPLGDGRVLAGGTFTATTAGYTAARLLRLKTDRTLDTSLPAAGWNGGVLALARTASGKILAGGSFSTPGRCLAQLLPEGAVDAAFTVPSTGWSGSAEVSALAVQAGGRIVAGGKFSFAPAGSFTRWAITAFLADGTPDLLFAARPNTDGKAEIRALLPAGTDNLFIAGRFTELTDVDGLGNSVKVPWAGVARLDAAGHPASPQRPAAWDDRTVWSLAILTPPGKARQILAGGDFSWPAARLTGLRADAPVNSVPVILNDPVPQTQPLRAGDMLRLSIAATAWPEPEYQWFRNLQPVPGANRAELCIPNVQPADAGAYTVRVSNAAGVVTSPAVKVSVYVAPAGFAPLAGGVSTAPLSIAQFTSNLSPVYVTVPFPATRIAVSLRLSHKDTNDLSATLIAPGGQRAKLFSQPDPSGRDFDQTVFDDISTLQLSDSLPPFRGTFQTGGTLRDLRPAAVTGSWFLEIENGGGQTAVLESWQLMIEGATAPVTYEAWRTGTIAGLPKTAPDEDADGDGVSNAQEWLFGPAPGDPGTGEGGIRGMTMLEDGTCRFQWQGWQSASYQLEWSLDMVHWQTAVEGIDFITDWTSQTEPSRSEKAVRLTIPGAAAGFWRLRGG